MPLSLRTVAVRCAHGAIHSEVIPLALLDMAGHLIRRLQQKSTAVFQSRLKEAGYDLTTVQFAAMQVLVDRPGIEQAEIAEIIAYDRATIGGVIDRLEKKGYVTRAVSQQDRRAREVSLTPVGQQVFTDIYPVVVDLQQAILSGLTAAEQQTFLALSRQLVLAEARDQTTGASPLSLR